jgi:hypothetical protein
MSRLTASDYTNVLDLIEAVSMTPTVAGVTRLRCSTACGYNTTDITASLRQNFPDNPMTDDEVLSLLSRGAKSGEFSKVCSDAVDPEIAECDAAAIGQPLYKVNQNMVKVNRANKVYADAFNAATVTTFDPCAPPVNPYFDGVVACTASNTAGIGGSAGFNGSC